MTITQQTRNDLTSILSTLDDRLYELADAPRSDLYPGLLAELESDKAAALEIQQLRELQSKVAALVQV